MTHSHFTFFLWVVLYALTPVLIPVVWAYNRRTDSGESAVDERSFPYGVRVLGVVLGFVIVLSAVALFAVPAVMIDVWPWAVSPLTARILSGWFALFGVVTFAVALDPRWSAARILIQSEILGFTLVLVGVVRVWDNFDTSNILTWGVVGGMVLYLLAILVLYVGMERR